MSDQVEKTLVSYENKIKELTKDLDFCSGGWNIKTTIGSRVYEIMQDIRKRHGLSTFVEIFKDRPDMIKDHDKLQLEWARETLANSEEFEWNLYHDMDDRNYNDVKKIKELTDELNEIKNVDLHSAHERIKDLDQEIREMRYFLNRITKDQLDCGFDSSFQKEYNEVLRIRKRFRLDEV